MTILLTNLLDDVKRRHRRVESMPYYRYIFRLRLHVLEGISNFFYKYAYNLMEDIDKMQYILHDKYQIAWTDDVANADDEYFDQIVEHLIAATQLLLLSCGNL